LAAYWGGPLPAPRDLPRLKMPELLGWHPQGDGRWWLGVPVPSGRIQDTDDVGLRSALREVVQRFGADPVFHAAAGRAAHQPGGEDRPRIEAALRATAYPGRGPDAAGRWTLACPALPTCGLALTEAERVRAPILARSRPRMARHGLAGERVSLPHHRLPQRLRAPLLR
jgi:sulfite reductase (ferredoxin)